MKLVILGACLKSKTLILAQRFVATTKPTNKPINTYLALPLLLPCPSSYRSDFESKISCIPFCSALSTLNLCSTPSSLCHPLYLPSNAFYVFPALALVILIFCCRASLCLCPSALGTTSATSPLGLYLLLLATKGGCSKPAWD